MCKHHCFNKSWVRRVQAALMVLTLTCSAQVWAQMSTPAATIKQFQMYLGWGYVQLDTSAAVNNVNGCQYFDSWFVIDLITDQERTLVAQLQLAYATGAAVQVYSLSCNNGGTSGYNTIDGVFQTDQ